jgi:GR25 family glycosyltransferase involved in LPS biosynthesis
MDQIEAVLIVDDNSSEEDRLEMQQLAPWAEFYWKTPEERGHCKSMNIILDWVHARNAEYIVHIEDDFEFYWQLPLVQMAVNVLEDNPRIGQCLFNNGYKESFEEIVQDPWGAPHTTMDGVRYYVHQYPANTDPCSYWPHFSLRPGVYRCLAIQKIGYFVDQPSFEAEYALRYTHAGYKTAYLETVVSEHIGRKTKDRFGNETNAYVLNATVQFGFFPFKTFIVNLARRLDRKQLLADQLSNVPFPYQWFNAVDGSALTPCAELNTLFRKNTKDMTIGQVGCALSHLKLWYKLIDDYVQTPVYLILEDDIRIAPLDKIWPALFQELSGFNYWDVVFVGYHTRLDEKKDEPFRLISTTTFESSFSISPGGTFGYFIRHTGARKLLEFIETHQMINAIDTVMQKAIDAGLVVKYVSPRLFIDSESTSDIQVQQPNLFDPDAPDDLDWIYVKDYINNNKCGL